MYNQGHNHHQISPPAMLAISICMVFVLLGLLWYALHEPLVIFFKSYMGAKFFLMDILVRYTPLAIFIDQAEHEALRQWLELAPPSQVGISNLYAALDQTGAYYRWPVVAALAVMCYFVGKKSIQGRFERRFMLETLMKEQAKMWHPIAPAVVENPLEPHKAKPKGVSGNHAKIYQDTARWAVAMTPQEWCQSHNLFDENNLLKKEEAAEAFAKQLQEAWNGVQALRPYQKALFAACALKGARARDRNRELLDRLCILWKDGGYYKTMDKVLQDNKEFMEEIEEIIAGPEGQEASKITDKHAYVETAFISLLSWARAMGGVMASSEFLWLKPTNRGLWYVLNNVGRRAYHVEASGAMAHWKAEHFADKPLKQPVVTEAVIAIFQYLDPEEYRNLIEGD